MANTFKFQKDWYEGIMNNPYVKTSPQEMAYILYAAMQYAFNDGEPIDIGAVFGAEFSGLNRDMPNIYGQMDKIKNYEKGKKEDVYDNEAIYQLRMEGKKGKEICQILGYSLDKEKSLSTTKGWKRAKEEKEKNTGSVQKSVENTESVQIDRKESVKNTEICIENIEGINEKDTEAIQKSVRNTENFTENIQKSVENTDSVQKSVQTDNTDSVKIVQKSVKNTEFIF